MLRLAWGIAKILLGITSIVAVFVQLISDTARADFSIINFFSYFTFECSILASITLIIFAICNLKDVTSRIIDLIRGAVVVYMIITGIVYWLLLANIPDTTGTSVFWVIRFLHYVLPTALVVDWFLCPPSKGLRYGDAFYWLVFPLLYIGYSITRGLVLDWYPYSFLDPSTTSITGIVQYILVIGAGVVVLSLITIQISRIRNKDDNW